MNYSLEDSLEFMPSHIAVWAGRVYRGEALGIKVEFVGIIVIPNTSLIHNLPYLRSEKVSRPWHPYLQVNEKHLQNLCIPIVQCGRVYRGEALGIKVEFVGISAKIRFVHGYLNDVLKQEF